MLLRLRDVSSNILASLKQDPTGGRQGIVAKVAARRVHHDPERDEEERGPKNGDDDDARRVSYQEEPMRGTIVFKPDECNGVSKAIANFVVMIMLLPEGIDGLRGEKKEPTPPLDASLHAINQSPPAYRYLLNRAAHHNSYMLLLRKCDKLDENVRPQASRKCLVFTTFRSRKGDFSHHENLPFSRHQQHPRANQ